MIDLHCHMLPGVDDGARDMDEALKMAQMAWEEGITHVVMTPHIHLRRYPNSLDSLKEPFQALQLALRANDCPLQIALASEVRMAPELLLNDAWKSLPSLGTCSRGRRVLLLEMPYSHVPAGTEQLLRWLLGQGVLPVIAHPERNREIMAHPPLALSLKATGAYLQGTVGAFVGEFGDTVKRVAWEVLDKGGYWYLATDSHRIDKRPPRVTEALERLRQNCGEALVTEMTHTRPWSLVQNRFSQ
ncbi:protein-tyrosine phosphatase [Ferrimonas sediminum]|uniref:protein-tyrosine-phosphatase n=1 Tax=Ferrimonas sediminum TaxID=718193 RepID=A0A1G8TM59_9GAMM|nr:CpsB/CapC family capsule biosynthesis tyrosine phosphatase [Ferrimonas sediminum]SDJ42503.1 protein-tyrosine phosphatase [Ferrimonas sediminum]